MVPVSTPGSESSVAGLGWLIAAPCIAVTIVALIVVFGERIGLEPLSAGRPGSPAEAAARGNLPELARLSQFGVDPRRIYPIPPSYTDFSISAATLAEAAVLSKNVGVVQYVERLGLVPNADIHATLVCLARDIAADEVMRHLTATAASPACTRGAAIAALRARTAG